MTFRVEGVDALGLFTGLDARTLYQSAVLESKRLIRPEPTTRGRPAGVLEVLRTRQRAI